MDIRSALRKSSKWKSLGMDTIPNFSSNTFPEYREMIKKNLQQYFAITYYEFLLVISWYYVDTSKYCKMKRNRPMLF